MEVVVEVVVEVAVEVVVVVVVVVVEVAVEVVVVVLVVSFGVVVFFSCEKTVVTSRGSSLEKYAPLEKYEGDSASIDKISSEGSAMAKTKLSKSVVVVSSFSNGSAEVVRVF